MMKIFVFCIQDVYLVKLGHRYGSQTKLIFESQKHLKFVHFLKCKNFIVMIQTILLIYFLNFKNLKAYILTLCVSKMNLKCCILLEFSQKSLARKDG